MTVDAILSLKRRGADFIAVTGGMSVDPDDQTPAAIRKTGARVVSYGAPTYPGAMFMLAYLDEACRWSGCWGASCTTQSQYFRSGRSPGC